MPTYYVEDYDGKREDEAEKVTIPLPPEQVQAKVVESAEDSPAPRKTSRAQTKKS